MSTFLGLDVGGANLKAAHSAGGASVKPFALWKEPQGLPDALRKLLRDATPADALAVTMTGELCDCYATKREGVDAILDAVEAVVDGRPVHVWRNDGRFVSVAAARAQPLLVASANWLAVATFAGRLAPKGPALLLDVGSTTTDIIPLRDGKPAPHARTDPERLACGELLYLGASRTPLCALLPLESAAEFFATVLDVFLVLGWQEEAPTYLDTADGRPATRAAAHARLARMLCADPETCPTDRTKKLAERALLKLAYGFSGAMDAVTGRMPAPPETVILAGSGEFLARAMLKQDVLPVKFRPRAVISLAEQLGPAVSAAACAHAVARLAAESSP